MHIFCTLTFVTVLLQFTTTLHSKSSFVRSQQRSCCQQRDCATRHKYELEGTQRVHISTKYTMMYTSTRLRKHLPTYAVDVSLANDNDVIDNDGVLWHHWCIFVQKN